MISEQLSFSWNLREDLPTADNNAATQEECETTANTALPSQPAADSRRQPAKSDLRRAALAFLAARGQTAAAASVRLRQQRLIVGAAGVRIAPHGKHKYSTPASVTLVDIFDNRQDCLPACAGYETLLEKLGGLEQDKLMMEEAIRRDEPELKISGDLFAENSCASYDYRASRIHPYEALLRKIERTRHSLYKGSRMENIRRVNAADYLYLAVPKGLIAPHELAPGWGLVYIDENLNCEVVAEAPAQTEFVNAEARVHLAMNIARATLDNVLFANGVRLTSERSAELSAVPRRRRRKTAERQ
ncbi:MAG: hypothetical protein PHI85_00325 [Victivallaceae bacterium]|nr:hypothetical protein [Victivallaceae bacterium]